MTVIDVGGLRVRCVAEGDPALAARLAETYAAFASLERDGSPAPARLSIRAQTGRETWQMPTVRLDGELVSVRAPGLEARFDCDANAGQVEVMGLPAGLAIEYVLRVVYMALAVKQGALIVHAAGVVRAGRAYLFWGRSGAGKTTAARVSRAAGEAEVLNDDLVLLRPTGRTWEAYGTPFTNPTQTAPGRPAHAPVRAILHLSQESVAVIRPLTRSMCLLRITAGVPVIMAAPRWAARALGLVEQLAHDVQNVQLGLRPEAGFWRVIEAWERDGEYAGRNFYE